MLFVDLLEHANVLPPYLATQIQTGVMRYLSGDSLEAILFDGGGPGDRTGRTRLKKMIRDHLIRQAYRAIPELRSTATRTQKLLEHIRRLRPVLRNYRAGHCPLSAVSLSLCQAAEYGDLPESLRQIQAICRKSGNELPVFIAEMGNHNHAELLNLPRTTADEPA